MNSFSDDCNELKKRYDDCFNAWFKDQFLKGHKVDKCKPLFKEYQACVKKAIQERKLELWEMEKPVLGTDREQKVPPGAEKTSQPADGKK